MKMMIVMMIVIMMIVMMIVIMIIDDDCKIGSVHIAGTVVVVLHQSTHNYTLIECE